MYTYFAIPQRHGSSPDQGRLREPIRRSALRAAIPPSAGDDGAAGRSLASALDQKVATKNAREAVSELNGFTVVASVLDRPQQKRENLENRNEMS